MRNRHSSHLFVATIITVLALLVAVPAVAERGDDARRASKNGKVTGTIDGVEVTLEFGRPNVRGRALWGELVPYGKVWRTGADEATTVTFSADVLIQGQKLAAGTYGLFTVPGESEWQFVFNKVAAQWGAFNYKESEDTLRVKAEPGSAEEQEAMNFEIDGSKVILRWGTLAVGFSVEKG